MILLWSVPPVDFQRNIGSIDGGGVNGLSISAIQGDSRRLRPYACDMSTPFANIVFVSKLSFALSLLLLVSVQPGCGPREVSIATGAWPWVPTTMELHGLSRFMIQDGEEILSLRVEFLDQDGDPTKYPGLLRIEIDPAGPNKGEESDFEFDLSDPEVNQQHWDHVSSTYRFRLTPEWDEAPLASTAIRIRVISTLEGAPDLFSGITLRRGR